jgi:NADPH:quinone reductase-like Zn-dependent oxidoreductase
MSRTIKFAKAGGPEVLEFVEVQVPAPGPNEVRIKVKAIGINRAEAMWRVDDYIEPVKKFPAGLGYEAAGSVDAVGKDVSGFAVGDDVNVIPSFSLNDYATYGEVILVPDHAVVRQPKALSFTEASSRMRRSPRGISSLFRGRPAALAWPRSRSPTTPVRRPSR